MVNSEGDTVTTRAVTATVLPWSKSLVVLLLGFPMLYDDDYAQKPVEPL